MLQALSWSGVVDASWCRSIHISVLCVALADAMGRGVIPGRKTLQAYCVCWGFPAVQRPTVTIGCTRILIILLFVPNRLMFGFR